MRHLRTTTSLAFLLALALGLSGASAHAATEIYSATLSGANEVPPNDSTATGTATISVDTETLAAEWTLEFSGLTAPQTGAHFHNAPAGSNGGVVFGLPLGSPVDGTWDMSQEEYDLLAAGNLYMNVHSEEFPGGEIRGQMMLETVGTEASTLADVKGLFR